MTMPGGDEARAGSADPRRAGAMTPQAQQGKVERLYPAQRAGRDVTPEPSGWSGVLVFAMLLFALNGAFNIIYGIAALFDDQVLVGTGDEVLLFDLTGVGWGLIGFGVVQVATSLALASGQRWALFVGVILAMLNALFNLAAISLHPVWSVIIIAIDVLLIYAMTVHGHELRAMTE